MASRILRRNHLIKDPTPIKKWKIVRGDLVELNYGKDKGKQGVVKSVIRKENRVIVEGCNLVKKHAKGTVEMKGGIITKEAPVHYSNLLLVDPKLGKGVRVGWKFQEDGQKVRVSKSSGEVIPKPELLVEYKDKRKDREDGAKDTPSDLVLERTFDELTLIPTPLSRRGAGSDVGGAGGAGVKLLQTEAGEGEREESAASDVMAEARAMEKEFEAENEEDERLKKKDDESLMGEKGEAKKGEEGGMLGKLKFW